MSSIRRSDPEYQNAMREAKELFDAAMAKSSTKGRVGRPKATPVAPVVVTSDDAEEVVDLEEIGEIGDITEVGDIASAAGTGAAAEQRRRLEDI